MNILRSVGLLASALAFAACATTGAFPSDASVRPATDTPDHFTLDAPPPSGSTTCQSPVTDPRTGEQLRFVRSMPGKGDYAVAVGRYGAREGELLRIDCVTYRPIGLVPR